VIDFADDWGDLLVTGKFERWGGGTKNTCNGTSHVNLKKTAPKSSSVGKIGGGEYVEKNIEGKPGKKGGSRRKPAQKGKRFGKRCGGEG